MNKMRIKGIVRPDRVFIIAEAGVNHNGDVALAKRLIASAAACGADAVKFQSFKARNVISKYAQKAKYQKESPVDTENQLAMLERLEIKDGDYKRLSEYAKKKKIIFLSTPKDIISAKLLQRVGIRLFKTGSSEINNFGFLEYIASLNKPIILSTGMSTLAEVKDAVSCIRAKTRAPLTLLHCVSEYPCPIEQVNLKAMLTLRDAFKLPVGYSDHTLGVEAVLAAVALGARVIEKHFTLDKNMRGPDHKMSMTPKEFADMVRSVRNVEKILGDGIKRPAPCEVENRKFLRRGLVFIRDMKKGARIGPDDIGIKRPGIGLEPKYRPMLINQTLKKDVREDEPVTWGLV